MSLGNILHRSKYSDEAAVVVEAALALSSSLNVHHFTLGNIYAVSVVAYYVHLLYTVCSNPVPGG